MSDVAVCGLAPPSRRTQPAAGPVNWNGFFSTAVDTWLTLAIARIGDSAASRLPIAASVSEGTR
jgi:hypothetical protein